MNALTGFQGIDIAVGDINERQVEGTFPVDGTRQAGAARLESILRGQDVLAHWTYSPAEWQPYAAAELNAQTQENRSLWWVICGFCLAIGGLFWLFDHEAGGIVFLVLLGMALLLAQVAFGLPRLEYCRQQRRPGEAWITPGTVFFDGNLAYWNYGGSRLDRVTWQASGITTQGGVPNAYWTVNPGIVIPAGTYTVIDSDQDTWAQNDETGGAGIAWGMGIRQGNP